MNRRPKKKGGPEKAPAVPSNAPVSAGAGDMPGTAGSRSLKSANRPAGLSDRWTVFGVCLFLAVITFAVFGRTLSYEFICYDDNLYVYENPVVQKGLTWEGFRWALTYNQIGHWHPLTWISHMLDCQLYGLNAGGHHLTNVLLHTAAVILLFLVLRRMTGFLWRSAFVAAVFAIHPLRVESVAWVAERKDVLSAFFFMLTLGAYTRYAQNKEKTYSQPSTLNYTLTLFFFALGLLSKNMLVTTPFVLLLLDYWPLNRLSSFTPRVLLRLVAEKIPLFVLTVGSCVATALAPETTAAASLPFALRVENAVVSWITYLWQMIHPAGLACLYPNPENHLPLWQVAGAAGLLLAISGAVFAFRKTHPCLIVGWLWYLGMMVPVIGIVQISYYAHADRYTYLPQIGLYVALTWMVADLCAGWRHCRVVLGGGAAVVLAALTFCACVQTSYWRNSESLWIHTLACTSGNYSAHNYLGFALFQKGRVDEAIAQYQTALQIAPLSADVHNNLGNALLQKGKVDEAMVQYQKALEINPDNAEAPNNLGVTLFQKGRADEATACFQKALEINPNNADAHNNLGNCLFKKGSLDEAIIHYRQALEINPDYTEALNNLGNALLQKGREDEAIVCYQRALQISPNNPGVQNHLAWVLATAPQASLRNGHQAVALAQQASQLAGGGNPVGLRTLAAAYAEAGRFPEAVETAQLALQLAEAQSNTALADSIKSQLRFYAAGLPYHQENK